MESRLRDGRVTGILVFVQLVLLIVPYVILDRGMKTDYLTSALDMSATIKTAVFLLFGTATVTMAIAIAVYPVFREYSSRWTLCLFAMSIVWFAMQWLDNANIMSMLALSRRFAESAGANADLYNMLAAQTRSSRIWTHYTELLVFDVWFAVFYGILLRFRLVPVAIGVIGLVAVVLHLIAIPLPMFIGYPSTQPLGASLAVSHLLVAGWLLMRGFPAKQCLSAKARGLDSPGDDGLRGPRQQLAS
jgi:hypothetical protein